MTCSINFYGSLTYCWHKRCTRTWARHTNCLTRLTRVELKQIHEDFTSTKVFIFVLANERSVLINHLFALIKKCPTHMHKLLAVEDIVAIVYFAGIIAKTGKLEQLYHMRRLSGTGKTTLIE